MRVHLYDATEKALEYSETKSITTAVDCAIALKAWCDRMTKGLELAQGDANGTEGNYICIDDLYNVRNHLRDVAQKYPSEYKSRAIDSIEQAIMLLDEEFDEAEERAKDEQ